MPAQAWLKIWGTFGQNSHNQSILMMSCYISRSILKNWMSIFWPLLTLHYIQRLSDWIVGLSSMGQGPWEDFRAASHFRCKAALSLIKPSYLFPNSFVFGCKKVYWKGGSNLDQVLVGHLCKSFTNSLAFKGPKPFFSKTPQLCHF
jgi:hypothetical protein